MVNILDCTLRDGGYVNNWNFTNSQIRTIINSLLDSNIELIECGFISNKFGMENDNSRFASLKVLNKLLKGVNIPNPNQAFLALLNYGECDIENFPIYTSGSKNSVSVLRLAFHKEDINAAYRDIKILIEKGYKVCVQPMVSLRYSDTELIEMINRFNDLDIYSIYIVDSFGSMNSYDFTRLYYLFQNNVKEGVKIGFHSHNNMQLAYSNAMLFTNINNHSDIIIDSSVYGMGRGAGNLNTELITDYLNNNYNSKYLIEPLLDIIESYLLKIYKETPWGFTPAHFISAKYECHPNYSSFLTNKKTLSVLGIEKIISKIEPNKKSIFDKEYITKLYIDFNTSKSVEAIIKCPIFIKEVLILASGPSVKNQKVFIDDFISNNEVIVISMNHLNFDISSDYVFFSNQRRYNKYGKQIEKSKLIVSSNIILEENHKGCFVVDYNDLVNRTDNKVDNVSLLFLQLLLLQGARKVYIAGLDGYDTNSEINYSYEEHDALIDKRSMLVQNEIVEEEIKSIQNKIEIKFLTESRYSNEKNSRYNTSEV
ncbi:MAG: aldolase catalytic domain-containing protein [Marinifilaceae bacterium]|jgi:4-hydroxy 2-oxovalerate aldolase|nr:aldolase catalytic domain-containing protein [Marinifilaceae bacterium]